MAKATLFLHPDDAVRITRGRFQQQHRLEHVEVAGHAPLPDEAARLFALIQQEGRNIASLNEEGLRGVLMIRVVDDAVEREVAFAKCTIPDFA